MSKASPRSGGGFFRRAGFFGLAVFFRASFSLVAFFCSALALAAFAFGAATWGIGGRVMHSSSGAAMGKMTMLAAVGGAILLGAGPAIIAWSMTLGGKA
jgi:hypothetical protein